jgi:hypothetical protein
MGFEATRLLKKASTAELISGTYIYFINVTGLNRIENIIYFPQLDEISAFLCVRIPV